jgi:hypothetical protein
MSRRTELTIQGDVKARARLRRLVAIADSEAERALSETAVEIIDLARRRVPVDTGFLSQSHFINRPTKRSGRSDVVFGYHAFYAGLVHETYAGSKGQAKYLQSAVDEIAPDIPSRVVRGWKKGMKRKDLRGFRMGLKGG